MTAAKKTVTMCCVTFGYQHLMLPADKGMRLVELLQSAFECEQVYDERGYGYVIGQQPDRVSLEIIRPGQVRAPKRPIDEATVLLGGPKR